jgi:translation initiation factor IF-1
MSVLGKSRDLGAEGQNARLTVDATVSETLPHAMYVAELDNGQRVTAHIGGTLKTTLVRLVPGDRVTIELSPYDLSRGRITRRHPSRK